jgi:hypothetical protein
VTSIPIDRVAARVISKGVRYEPAIKFGQQMHFDSPPPMKVIPEMLPGGPMSDMVGMRRGKLTVVGLLAERISTAGATWVVRCDCGAYEIRKAKGMRAGSGDNVMCRKCQHLKSVKWKCANASAAARAAERDTHFPNT